MCNKIPFLDMFLATFLGGRIMLRKILLCVSPALSLSANYFVRDECPIGLVVHHLQGQSSFLSLPLASAELIWYTKQSSSIVQGEIFLEHAVSGFLCLGFRILCVYIVVFVDSNHLYSKQKKMVKIAP
jgi:hypothetical protein